MSYPSDSLPKIMRRTQTNLQIIREVREQRRREGTNVDTDGPFEVTQLVNSFLAAFAHPWEVMFKGKSAEQYPVLCSLEDHLVRAESLCPDGVDLIGRLGFVRHAFAHGNVEFISDRPLGPGPRDISQIRIWNCSFSKKNKNWEAVFSVDQLSALLNDFASIANGLYNPHEITRDKDCPGDSD